MAILGNNVASTSPYANADYRSMRMVRILPPYAGTVNSISVYFTGPNEAITVGSVGIYDASTRTPIANSFYKGAFQGTPEDVWVWGTHTYSAPKPALVCGTPVWAGVSNYDYYESGDLIRYGAATLDMMGGLAADNGGDFNKQLAAITANEKHVCIYLDYTPTGDACPAYSPEILIEGVTPGKLEHTSYPLLSDVY